MFPEIRNINDLLPHIEGNDNFSINRKDDYIVVDYILNTPDLFNNPWEKECRGIIFDAETGAIRSRRLHKFFNLNERPESAVDKNDLSEPHVILDKLDGSMITPLRVNGELTWASKAGVTFLTPQIKEFVKNNPQYVYFVEWAERQGLTPIFEWCSRKNRIVIDYPVDRLVLIAMRQTISGDYYLYDQLIAWAKAYGIDYVKALIGTVRNMQQFSDEVKNMIGLEGFVIAFKDGHRIKIKADEYIRYHRAKDDINFEKNVIAILVNNQADDFRTLLSHNDLARFEKFENDFFVMVGRNVSHIQSALVGMINEKITKKQFALEFQNNVNSLLRRIFFKYLEGDRMPSYAELYEDVINILKTKVSSQSSVNEARQIFHINWVNY